MRKLKLDLASLNVESFEVSADDRRHGTVRGAYVPPAYKVPVGDPNDTLYDACTAGYTLADTGPCNFTQECVPSVNIPDTWVAPCTFQC